jgi:putative PIN family toxin of toxin-antitoxin system
MMQVVLDTNLIISGMFWMGLPHDVLLLAYQHKMQALTSEPLIEELKDVISRDKFNKNLKRLQKTPDDMINLYLSHVLVIEPSEVPQGTVRDLKDDKIIACAVGGQANYIITGDDDLLVLKQYQAIHIVTASQFLTIIK